MQHKDKYLILKKSKYKTSKFQFSQILENDIEKIRRWRNQQKDVLRQNKNITKSEQLDYFNKIILSEKTLKYPSSILFSIKKNNTLIGYLGLVHILWYEKIAEISFLLDTKIKYDSKKFISIFENSIVFLKTISFKELNFFKIYTECFENRLELIKKIEKLGFVKEGYKNNFYLKKNKYISSVIHSLYNTKKIPSNSKKILITSSGAKNSLYLSLKKAITKNNSDFEIVLGDSNNNVVSKHYPDFFWKMPSTNHKNIKLILKKCLELNIKMIIPSRDSELIFWSKNKLLFKKNGIIVAISNYSSVKLCLDKFKFYKYCKSKKIPTIPTFLGNDRINLKKQVVIKNRFSYLEKSKIRKTKDIYKQNRIFTKNEIIQPLIKSNEYSADTFFNQKKIEGLVIRKRDIIINGEAKVSSIIIDNKLYKRLKNILNKFNFEGHINIQFFYDKNNNLKILEINPRFGGASILSVEAGLDSFNWLIQRHFYKKNKIKFVLNENVKKLVKNYKDLII